MDLNISFNECECDRIFSRMQDIMHDIKKAYEMILASREEDARQWQGDSSETFKAQMLLLSERLTKIDERWQNLVTRYEKARDCVKRLDGLNFA